MTLPPKIPQYRFVTAFCDPIENPLLAFAAQHVANHPMPRTFTASNAPTSSGSQMTLLKHSQSYFSTGTGRANVIDLRVFTNSRFPNASASSFWNGSGRPNLKSRGAKFFALAATSRHRVEVSRECLGNRSRNGRQRESSSRVARKPRADRANIISP
jgi:hypothetical protein